MLLIIVILQTVYWYVNSSVNGEVIKETEELIVFQKQIDSLKLAELEKRKPKLYPFNPNFITDFKGYQLGMSVEEIDRLHSFRRKNKYVNSAEEFQEVTKVSDSLLLEISPRFKFPDWVIKKNQKKKESQYKANQSILTHEELKREVSVLTNDINKATKEDFETITGVGEVLSDRILKYRNKLQGYSYDYQLFEVWGLEKGTVKRLLKVFQVKTKPRINKLNVNTATFKELLKNPYIDYELCKKIFEYRDEVAELQNITELRNIKDFPLEKYDRIILYLEAK